MALFMKGGIMDNKEKIGPNSWIKFELVDEFPSDVWFTFDIPILTSKVLITIHLMFADIKIGLK